MRPARWFFLSGCAARAREMHDFTTFIRQCTQGRGSFTFGFERYEEAPANVAQKVIEEAKAENAE